MVLTRVTSQVNLGYIEIITSLGPLSHTTLDQPTLILDDLNIQVLNPQPDLYSDHMTANQFMILYVLHLLGRH